MVPILRFGEIPDEKIFARERPGADHAEAVAALLKTVRTGGDEALRDLCERYDGVRPAELEVSRAERRGALEGLDPALLAVLRQAADNIRLFHERQRTEGFRLEKEGGIVLGQRVLPMERVGICVPGGRTPLCSTVLMNAIPARLAGVKEIIMVTPNGPDGVVAPALLAAAELAGVDRVFRLGGAQAVAALAYGTESVPKVDKIVGPGGAFVSEAKRQVFGEVAIDMVAGPSEILIVADGANDAAVLAADMLSQAEHDVCATAVLVTDSEALAAAVQAELERQVALLPRREIAQTSLDGRGKIIVTDNLPDAVAVANRLAPEHLELCVEEPFRWLERVENAGSVFLGRNCPEALGDYLAGVNHTLPTAGAARFSSPLGVEDFVRRSQYLYYPAEALAACAEDIARFARAEALEGHARSALSRGGTEVTQ